MIRIAMFKFPLGRMALFVVAMFLSVPAGFLMSRDSRPLELRDPDIKAPTDLAVLTHVVGRFKVENMPATLALEHLWTLASGRKPEDVVFGWYSESDEEEPKISLDLKDVPVSEAIGYISDLSSSRWEISGRPNSPMILRLKRLAELDDTETFMVWTVVALSRPAAELLGLKDGLSSDEVVKRLRYFGVGASSEQSLSGIYNGKTEKLAMSVPIREREYLVSVARMAVLGRIIQYKPEA